jgi:ABC-type transport system substrate-binding protein
MPDPVVGLQMVFDSRNVTSLYGRDDLNAIIDQAGAAFDNTERGELIKQAFRIINEDLPVIPILAGVEVYLMNSNVDYDPPPTFMPRPCVKYMSFND